MANNAEWIYEIGASRQFCARKDLMQHFKDVTEGEYVYKETLRLLELWVKGISFSNLLMANYYP